MQNLLSLVDLKNLISNPEHPFQILHPKYLLHIYQTIHENQVVRFLKAVLPIPLFFCNDFILPPLLKDKFYQMV